MNELQGCKSESWLNCLLSRARASFRFPRLRSIQWRLPPGGNDVLRRCCGGVKGSDARGAQKESGREEDGTRRRSPGETAGKLEIFIAAPFPFYAESRGRGQRSIHCALMRFAIENVITGRYFKRHRNGWRKIALFSVGGRVSIRKIARS